MKILQIISSLRIGGAERLLTEIVPRMRSLGHEVDVLVLDGTRTSFREQLEKNHIKVMDLGVRRNVYNPILVFPIIRVIRHYDIVHTHLTSPQYLVSFANLFVRKALLTTEHSTSNRRRDKALFHFMDRWMYQQYNFIITISKEAEYNLKKYLGEANYRVITINNGIDVNKFRLAFPLSEKEKKTKKYVVTMVGAFRHQKDQITLINAFRRLNQQRFELWLVGDGEKKEEALRHTHELGLTDSVRFWGNRDDVPAILKSSDIVVLSSIWEGFGLAAVEGMAAGKPVIASNVDGLSQVVQDAGLLFNVGDDMHLAELINQLIDDTTFYASVASRCSERATHFSIDKMIDGYLDVYKKVL